MTVAELIEKLTEFSPKAEVTISDGLDLRFYHTNGVDIRLYEGSVDIGIGGCLLEDLYEEDDDE